MKISELITKLEQQGNFKDDPEVHIRVVTVAGAENFRGLIEFVDAGAGGKVCDLVLKHNCPERNREHLYYWNGKLLDSMDRDELQAALVMMLEKQPVAKITGTAPAAKEAPKATTPAPAKS